MQEFLFFVALLPDESLQEEVTRFKEYAAEHFDTRRALRAPPHITLVPPFRWPMGRLDELKGVLAEEASREAPFPVMLDGFGCFPPRVIFVAVAANQQLAALQSRLEIHLAARLGLKPSGRPGFHPHMTVAFKDLKKRLFPAAWAYFSRLNFQKGFEAGKFILLQHNGREWEVATEFAFRGKG